MTWHPVHSIPTALLFLAVLLTGMGLFVHAIRLRFNQVRMAKRPEIRWDEVPQRIKNVLVFVLGQNRLPKNGYL